MIMVITIKSVSNGFVLEYFDGEDNITEVVESSNESEDSEVDAFAGLLWKINSLIGPSTSRYSNKRIYVEVKPGDKNPAHEDNING